MENILTKDQRFLLKLLLNHNDSEKVKSEYTQHLFQQLREPYIKAANGNENVVDGFLSEQLMLKAEQDAKKALPLLGDEIIAWCRSYGGRTHVKKNEAVA
jgi:hypothetical protein